MIKNICRTTSSETDGRLLYERFTTKGYDKKASKYSSFAANYTINKVPRADVFTNESLLSWFCNSDMIRVTGIRLELNIGVSPKSGWRVRLLLIQSPLDMSQITGYQESNNYAYYPDEPNNPQGGFTLNGGSFTQVHGEPDRYEASIVDKYKNLFKFQRKKYDHKEYQDVVLKLKVTHTQCKVVYEKNLLYINKKSDHRRFKFNYLVPSRTTWKYPYLIHDGTVDETNPYGSPDRKMVLMILATPIFGEVPDGGEPMFDIERLGARDVHHGDQHRTDRAGSVVRDEFQPPEAAPMDLAPDAGVQPHPEQEPREGPGIPDPGPAIVNQMWEALRRNRRDAQEEAARRRAELPPKPPKPEKLETNEYGWAYDQTIMIRPVVDIFFKNMPLKRVGYR